MTTYLLTASNQWLQHPSIERDLLLRNASLFERDMTPEPFAWPVRRSTSYSQGDNVFLLLQGSGGPRGIIASGFFADEPVQSIRRWNRPGTKVAAMTIHWETTVLPDEVLETELLRDYYPETNWVTRGAMTEVDPFEEASLEEEWSQHLTRLGYFTGCAAPSELSAYLAWTSPRFTETVVHTRSHLRAFRHELMHHHPPACSFCGLDQVEVLEPAHLVPPALGGASIVENGRLLCANHLRSFEQGVLRWDGSQFVESAPWLRVPPPQTDHDMSARVYIALQSHLAPEAYNELLDGGIPPRMSLSDFVELCTSLAVDAQMVLRTALSIIFD